MTATDISMKNLSSKTCDDLNPRIPIDIYKKLSHYKLKP
ncbi:MAG: hypothetical protein BAJALOKI1v1_1360002 [Promethearchaeota archaeon]|nr:MAG: hypothetical protein BAJALOKI1v1_1360002 [Candidatus Lokiarchaeota archaeon]